MATEAIPRIMLVAFFLAFGFTRMAYQIHAGRNARSKRMQDSIAAVLAVSLGGLCTVTLTSAYLAQFTWIRWAHLGLPTWLRWAGILLAGAAIVLNVWIHRVLGTNFSATLRIKEGHTLVTSGPYRWVRHPMYAIFVVVGFAVLLISANALVGGSWLAQVALVVSLRVRREERALLGTFGEVYQRYRESTGCLIPRLGLPTGRAEEPVRVTATQVAATEARDSMMTARVVRRGEAAATPFETDSGT